MLVYLGICAVLCFAGAVAGLAFAVSPTPTFLHLAFAAGAMPLIFGAIIHFVPVLTRSGHPHRAIYLLPLAVQAAGVVTPLALAGELPYGSLHPAATVVAGSAIVLMVWLTRRLRTTFGAPHPGARWYGAALLCLFFAVSLVPVWLALPELRPALRLFHLHLNTLGFIGLAALGTLPVLLPTVLKCPDPAAAARLRSDLPWATAGVLGVAAGAAFQPWLAAAGALLLLWCVANTLRGWWPLFGQKVDAWETAPLLAATMGLIALLAAGGAHAFGYGSARAALGGFVALFLLPLVSGALAQLLPVWRHPGPDSPRRRALRKRLVAGGGRRSSLFALGGLLWLFDSAGFVPTALGLLDFAARLLVALWLDRLATGADNAGQA